MYDKILYDEIPHLGHAHTCTNVACIGRKIINKAIFGEKNSAVIEILKTIYTHIDDTIRYDITKTIRTNINTNINTVYGILYIQYNRYVRIMSNNQPNKFIIIS